MHSPTGQIPLVDLAAQHAALREELQEAMDRVIASSAFIQGPDVRAFEEEFAAYCGARYGVGVGSGTAALQLSLLAVGVEPGDEVITVPFTFIATAEAIAQVGAWPVFVDVDPYTMTMDPKLLEEAVTPCTRAIIPVHLYGQCAEMDPILEVASRYGLKVVADAAQAHGAEYRGRRVGSLADASIFSFYPGKNLGALGDAGMVLTDQPSVADKVRMLADHGRREKYLHEIEGFGHRLDTLQAAILRVKLRYLERWTEARRRHARRYTELLAGTPVCTPHEGPHMRHVYHLYVIRTPQREALLQHLRARGVGAGVHYPVPLHRQPVYRKRGYGSLHMPESERAAAEVLSLPMYPELRESQIEDVARMVKEYLPRL